MRTTTASAAVLAVAATGLGSGLASPALAEPTDLRCRFTSITDPTVEGDVQVGQANAGPIVDAGATGGDVQITCTIQVNQPFHGAGAGGASVSSQATPGAATIPPSQISYVSPEGSTVYMCTKVTIGGQAYYWNSTGGVPEGGSWSTTVGGPCSTAISQEVDPPLPADAVVIVAPGGGLEPIHFVSEPIHANVAGWDCSSYTWDSVARVYAVDCTSTSSCGTVTVASVGALGMVTGTTFCQGGNVATAVSPGVAVASEGASSWRCIGVFLGIGGLVDCDVVTL